MWETVAVLVVILIITGIVVFLWKEPGDKITVFNKTYPIEIQNEFGEIHNSYVEYWIARDSRTKELTFHYSGKFAKSHRGYNDAYDYYLKLIADGNRSNT